MCLLPDDWRENAAVEMFDRLLFDKCCTNFVQLIRKEAEGDNKIKI